MTDDCCPTCGQHLPRWRQAATMTRADVRRFREADRTQLPPPGEPAYPGPYGSIRAFFAREMGEGMVPDGAHYHSPDEAEVEILTLSWHRRYRADDPAERAEARGLLLDYFRSNHDVSVGEWRESNGVWRMDVRWT